MEQYFCQVNVTWKWEMYGYFIGHLQLLIWQEIYYMDWYILCDYRDDLNITQMSVKFGF